MSIHNRLNKAYQTDLLKDFKDNPYLPKTPEGLIQFLFDDEIESDYVVYRYKEQYDKTTLSQRLNRIWVLPIWFVVAPFKWLLTGSSGVNQHSKYGVWLSRITGL